MFERIKKFIQRGRHGISEEDMWSLDYYLADVIIKGVKYLRKRSHGYPVELIDTENEKSTEDDERHHKEWLNILSEIEWTFETAKKIVDSEVTYIKLTDYEEMIDKYKALTEKYDGRVLTVEEIKRFNRGFRLFKKHFFSLWD